MSYKVIDLFCGCGGLSHGFQQAGYHIVAGVDIDKQALTTYQNNFKGAQAIESDIFELEKNISDQFKNCDVLLGGPPCQGFSLAGKLDISDKRNQLIFSYLNIINKIKPKAVVIENVPNILNFDNGAFAEAIVKGLEKIGYLVDVFKINCSDYGVPQNRNRVFFIATIKTRFSIDQLENFKVIIKQTTNDAISDLPILDNELGEFKVPYRKKSKNKYQKTMRENSIFIYNHEAVNHTDKTKKIISLVPDGGNYKDLPIELQSTRKVNIAWTRMNSQKPCFTIDAGHNHHFHYSANRVPTVRECARIQSFPDDFIFYGNRTSQYRQVGNAVPPLVAKIIANILLDSL
jgi:DNA (cytosine-5)-methyltransferase 1